MQLCDELLSEEKATSSKVQRGLLRNGHTVSLSTIYRIARDLTYRWQKPWHTDILTPAQKYKRKLFCAELLRLSEAAMLHRITDWMFSDEKWWDIVGPACYKYVKAESAFEVKQRNQVFFTTDFHLCFHLIDYSFCCCRCLTTKVKRAA